MKFGAWIILIGLALIALGNRAHAHEQEIYCIPPTINTNETPLTDLAEFRLYGGLQQQKLIASKTVAQGCRFLDPSTTPGKHVYYVTAVSASGNESEPSNTITLDLVAPQCQVSPPPPESQTQICPLPSIGNWQQTRTYVSAPPPVCWTAGPWVPTEAAAGICSSPALITAGPLAYERRGTATSPTMVAIGLVAAGLPCGPTVQLVGNVKYCAITRAQTDVVNWPVDLKVQTLWSRSQ